jgi:hypothetical protein
VCQFFESLVAFICIRAAWLFISVFAVLLLLFLYLWGGEFCRVGSPCPGGADRSTKKKKKKKKKVFFTGKPGHIPVD